MPRISPTSLVLCALALVATRAAADPAGEQLFRDGRELLKQGKVDLACEKFQQSREVEAKVGTLLNLGDCRERQGKLATAWDVFLEAKSLAAMQKDPRAAEAERRANAIVGQRAFLTVAVAPDHRVPGLVVTRNGAEVPPATWDQALPIDPGSYVFEAKAQGYAPAIVKVEIAPRGRGTATVPALTKFAVAVTPVEPPVTPVVTPDPGRLETRHVDPVVPNGPPTPPAGWKIDPPLGRGALGVALGATSDGDLTPGLRAIVQTEAGPGAIRGVFNMQYVRVPHDPSYSGDNSNQFAFGLGLDYLVAWKPGFASAAGIGVGLDLFTGGYDNNGGTADPSVGLWKAVRMSPIIARLRSKPVELGLHAVIIVQSHPVLVATAAVDWFFW